MNTSFNIEMTISFNGSYAKHTVLRIHQSSQSSIVFSQNCSHFSLSHMIKIHKSLNLVG